MLRINLATRPFYNERAIHLLLWVVAGVALLVLGLDGMRLASLSAEHAALTAEAERDERQGNEIRQRTSGLQDGLDPRDLERMTRAAAEANQLIDQRMFSWTRFFNLIEATLPADVRLTSLRPRVEAQTVELAMGVVGRDVVAIFEFIERLEATGAFRDVLARQEEMTDDGMYRSTLTGRYSAPVEPVGAPTESAQ